MLQKQLNRFSGGLDWDTTPQLVPTDRYEFALNAIMSDKIGDKGGLIFEYSNASSALIPNGYKIIGNVKSTLQDKESYVLFSCDDATKVGEIGIYYPQDNKYQRIVRSACFNFHSNHPVNAIIKIKSDNTRVLYFTDKVNPYKSLNIDSISDYLDNSNNLICDRILFAPSTNIPVLSASAVSEGGNLKLGQYRFYIRYLAKDKTTTNIVAHSESIQIYRNNTFATAEGGYNLNDSNYADQSYPNTSKSIRLNISNADTDFNSYQIIVVAYTSGTGAVSSVTISEEIPINQTTWTYTGSNTTATIALDDVIIDRYNAYIVGAHTEKDNRLWIANLIESEPLNYATIQRAALNIKVRWKAKRIPKFDITRNGNGLNPISYKTFMRDEVYALGIVGTDINGNKTPVFHIPGRAAVTNATGKIDQNEVFITRRDFSGAWDKQLLDTSGVDVMPHEVSHLSQFNAGNQMERWRIYNTSWIDTTNSNEFAGELAYYQNESLYPDIDTPAGKLYGALTGTPIRHHKMPDSNTIPHVSNTELRPLTLNIDITDFISALPTSITSKIQKWEIVTAERTEENKTVLDKGITTFNECNRLYLKFTSSANGFDIVNFYSPKTLFGQKALSGTHYKTEWYNSYWDIRNGNTDKHFQETTTSFPSGMLKRAWFVFRDWTGKTNTDNPILSSDFKSNFKIKSSQYIASSNVKNGEETFTQSNFSGNPADSLSTRNYIYDTQAFKIEFENNKLIHPIAGSGLNTPFRGHVTYGSIKSEKSVYEILSSIVYAKPSQVNLSSTIVELTEGDSFLSPMTVVLSDSIKENAQHGIWHEVHHVFVESDINCGLRHETNVFNKLDNQLYYTGWSHSDGTTGIDNPTINFYDYLKKANGSLGDVNWDKDSIEGNGLKQAYLYNVDYNDIKPVKRFISLSDSYNYFNANSNKEYYRYRYSEKDFDDELTDNYRNIKVNNTGTISAESGAIRDIFVDKNKLFIRTNKTLLYLPTNQQTLKTNDNTVYLGTGEVAPFPAQSISEVDWSYGGGYNFQHRLTTEFGTVLVDIYSRKVFLLRDGLQDITPSMESFWQQYGKWDLLDKGVDYFPNHLTIVYDTYAKRFLITQKHWKFKPDKFTEYLNSSIVYDEANNVFRITNNDTNVTVVESPTNILELEEWTISYSFLNNAWTSFHSYKHDWQFSSDRGFIGFKNSFLWKHYIDDEQTFLAGRFNNVLYPMQLEWTVNEPAVAEKYLEHINIESSNNKWSTTYAYSKNQHTGILPIEVNEESSNVLLNRILNTVNLSSKENYFKIDNYKDKTIDINVPIFSNTVRWNKQINTSNFTTSNFMYEGKIKGKWIKVGLTYMPSLANKNRQTIWAAESAFKIVQR